MVPYGVDSGDSALQQGRIDDTRSSLARGRSGSRRVGRFMRFSVVPVAGSLGGVSSASGALLLASGCARMLWVLCGTNSARCDDVVGLGSRWVACTVATKCCRSKTCNILSYPSLYGSLSVALVACVRFGGM